MKRQWLTVIIVLITNFCSAQNLSLLNNILYYSVGSSRRVAEIKLEADSLLFSEKLGLNSVARKQYKIIEEEQRGRYILAYVQDSENITYHNNDLMPTEAVAPTGLFIFLLKNDKLLVQHQVYPLHISREIIQTVPLKLKVVEKATTLEEIKEANSKDQFKSKYFLTWYSPSSFIAIKYYADLKNATKTTIKNVADNWLNNLARNKSIHPGNGDNFYRDNLTKLLIANQLNPLIEIDDLYQKLIEYHIALPYLPVLSKYKVLIKPKNRKDVKEIRIDEPVS